MPGRRTLFTLAALALALLGVTGLGLGQFEAPRVATVGRAPALPGSGATLGRRGQQLYLEDRAVQLTGVNAYQLATDPTFNFGCGEPVDLDAFFASAGRGRVVRTFLLQTEAVNRRTQTFNWSAIDRLFAAAARHGVLLIATLSDQTGNCDDGHWHDQAWYAGGYRSVYDDNGDHTNLVSYWDWLHLVVARYASSPALAMWEPVNEPETANCPAPYSGKNYYGHTACPGGNAQLLRAFFDSVGGELHRIDPKHLVSSGTIGNGECGNWMQYYQLVGASPGIDVLTVHDYDPTPLNPTMRQHVAQAATLNKPLLFEEVSIASGPGCATSTAARATALKAKENVDLRERGVAGFLLWQWVASVGPGCYVAYAPGDPALREVAGFAS